MFNGEPEEWPGFVCQLEQSTQICGYSPEENMLRLQRCLKGKAKDAVKSILYLPDKYENVIKTLSMSFGRPTMIKKNDDREEKIHGVA